MKLITSNSIINFILGVLWLFIVISNIKRIILNLITYKGMLPSAFVQDAINCCPNLERLVVEGNGGRDSLVFDVFPFHQFAKLKKLEMLYINSNVKVSRLALSRLVSSIPSLKSLHFIDCDFMGDAADVAQIRVDIQRSRPDLEVTVRTNTHGKTISGSVYITKKKIIEVTPFSMV